MADLLGWIGTQWTLPENLEADSPSAITRLDPTTISHARGIEISTTPTLKISSILPPRFAWS